MRNTFGVIIILAIILLHVKDSNNEKEKSLHDLRIKTATLIQSLAELEERTALEAVTIKDKGAYKIKHVAKVTAYNTLEEQTDSTPCISASGKNVCGLSECTIAMNGVPFGTVITIDTVGTCTVVDRKNARYSHEWIDINFDKDINGALSFGVRELEYSFN